MNKARKINNINTAKKEIKDHKSYIENVPCCCCSRLFAKSCLTLAAPWTVACQDPLSMRFPRQEYWSGLQFPVPGGLPNPGIKPCLLHWQADSLLLGYLGRPQNIPENLKTN